MYFSMSLMTLLVAQTLGAAYHGPEAKPVVRPDGFLADTHDVASAKNLHLGALSQAAAHSGGDNHYEDHEGGEGHHTAYHGPQAVPKVLPDGHIADTHEVSSAKKAHLAALAEAHSHNPGSSHGEYHEDNHEHHENNHEHHDRYHGPLAKPVVLPSGHLADTHEVAAAKGAHLDAVAHAHH
ncbi:hypothetical protein J6590_000932 [Homalodisca vitripennis]|nr:hypothetical protein J6590_000932 [Homalodisca vitripennis]